MNALKSDLNAISSALVRSRNSVCSPRCYLLLITIFVLFCITALASITGYYSMVKVVGLIFIGLSAHAFLTREEYRHSSWDSYIVALLINYTPCNKDAYLELLSQIDKNCHLQVDLIAEWIVKEK